MSKETRQFLEMTKRAYHAQKPVDFRLHYCEMCGMHKPHKIETDGLDEIYICQHCGYEKWYRVK